MFVLLMYCYLCARYTAHLLRQCSPSSSPNQLRAKLQEREGTIAGLECSCDRLQGELAALREQLVTKERELGEVLEENGAFQSQSVNSDDVKETGQTRNQESLLKAGGLEAYTRDLEPSDSTEVLGPLKTGDQESLKTGHQEPLTNVEHESLKRGDQEKLMAGDQEKMMAGDQEKLMDGDKESMKSAEEQKQLLSEHQPPTTLIAPTEVGDQGLSKAAADQGPLKNDAPTTGEMGSGASEEVPEQGCKMEDAVVVRSGEGSAQVLSTELPGSKPQGSTTSDSTCDDVAARDTKLEEALAQVRQLNSEREEKLNKIRQLEEELMRAQESFRTEGT